MNQCDFTLEPPEIESKLTGAATLQELKKRALSRRGCNDKEGLDWPLRLDGLPAGLVAWAAFRAGNQTPTSYYP
jgi:hypothetical protein